MIEKVNENSFVAGLRGGAKSKPMSIPAFDYILLELANFEADQEKIELYLFLVYSNTNILIYSVDVFTNHTLLLATSFDFNIHIMGIFGNSSEGTFYVIGSSGVGSSIVMKWKDGKFNYEQEHRFSIYSIKLKRFILDITFNKPVIGYMQSTKVFILKFEDELKIMCRDSKKQLLSIPIGKSTLIEASESLMIYFNLFDHNSEKKSYTEMNNNSNNSVMNSVLIDDLLTCSSDVEPEDLFDFILSKSQNFEFPFIEEITFMKVHDTIIMIGSEERGLFYLIEYLTGSNQKYSNKEYLEFNSIELKLEPQSYILSFSILDTIVIITSSCGILYLIYKQFRNQLFEYPVFKLDSRVCFPKQIEKIHFGSGSSKSRVNVFAFPSIMLVENTDPKNNPDNQSQAKVILSVTAFYSRDKKNVFEMLLIGQKITKLKSQELIIPDFLNQKYCISGDKLNFGLTKFPKQDLQIPKIIELNYVLKFSSIALLNPNYSFLLMDAAYKNYSYCSAQTPKCNLSKSALLKRSSLKKSNNFSLTITAKQMMIVVNSDNDLYERIIFDSNRYSKDKNNENIPYIAYLRKYDKSEQLQVELNKSLSKMQSPVNPAQSFGLQNNCSDLVFHCQLSKEELIRSSMEEALSSEYGKNVDSNKPTLHGNNYSNFCIFDNYV